MPFFEKLLKYLPSLLVVVYWVVFFVVCMGRAEWGYYIAGVITYPFGYLLFVVDGFFTGFILNSDPMLNELWQSKLNGIVRFMVYFCGGSLWYYLIGLLLRRGVRIGSSLRIVD